MAKYQFKYVNVTNPSAEQSGYSVSGLTLQQSGNDYLVYDSVEKEYVEAIYFTVGKYESTVACEVIVFAQTIAMELDGVNGPTWVVPAGVNARSNCGGVRWYSLATGNGYDNYVEVTTPEKPSAAGKFRRIDWDFNLGAGLPSLKLVVSVKKLS